MEDKRTSGVWVAVAVFLALPIFYVLSVGPMVTSFSKDAVWLEYLYAPIGWIINKSDAAHDLYRWYLSCWR